MIVASVPYMKIDSETDEGSPSRLQKLSKNLAPTRIASAHISP